MTRRLFQLTRCHIDLVLVSDEVGHLKNNLIDTSGADKVTNKCKQSETRSKIHLASQKQIPPLGFFTYAQKCPPPPRGNRTRASHSLQAQHYPFYTNLTCAAQEIFKLLFMHHLIFGLGWIHGESIEHDYIRVLKSQSYKQMSSQCRKNSVGVGIRGYERPGWVLFPLKVTFCHWIFLFSCSKDKNATIGIFV